eukprot:2938166-Amphidinium_carterae.2
MAFGSAPCSRAKQLVFSCQSSTGSFARVTEFAVVPQSECHLVHCSVDELWASAPRKTTGLSLRRFWRGRFVGGGKAVRCHLLARSRDCALSCGVLWSVEEVLEAMHCKCCCDGCMDSYAPTV